MRSSVVGVPTGQAIGPVEVRSVRKLGFNARRVVLYTVLYLILVGVYGKEHLPVVIAGGYPSNEAVAILLAGTAAISYLLGGFLMSAGTWDGGWCQTAMMAFLVVAGMFSLGYIQVLLPWAYAAVAALLVTLSVAAGMGLAISVERSNASAIKIFRKCVLAVFAMSLILAVCGIGCHQYKIIINDIGRGKTAQEMTLSRNADSIGKLFDQSKWQALSLEERATCVSDLVMVEANYLSVQPPDLQFGFPREKARAAYFPWSNTVFVSFLTLRGSGPEVASTVLHEMAHVAERHEVRGDLPEDSGFRQDVVFDEEDVAAWAIELQHYSRGEDDIDEYSNQSIERTARLYAFSASLQIQLELKEKTDG